MKLEAFDSAGAASCAAAAYIVCCARASIAARRRFLVAFSGGHSPAGMLRAFAEEDLPWKFVHVFQVDERIAPAGHTDRNLTGLDTDLLARAGIPAAQVHPMPVEESDPVVASSIYQRTLEQIAGTPPVLDLVHLGIGGDGHTASLIPDDPVLGIENREVAVTGLYQRRRRMTMTFPMLNRARERLWLVIEAQKAEVLARLLDGDESIPAGRVTSERTTVFAVRSAVKNR